MGQSLPNTFTKKGLGHLLYKYTRMVHAKKAWQLHTHMNLVNIFPKQNKKHINKGCQHINFSSSVFLVLDWIVYQWEVEVQLSWIGLGLHCLQLGCLKIYPWLPASTSTSTIAINKSSIENQNNIDI